MGVAACAEQGAIVKRNIPTMIGLGRLVDMVIRDAKGQRQRVTPTSEIWLAWKSDTRDLVVLRPGHGKGSRANRGDARRHQQFHGAEPEQARPMDWPAPCGAVSTLGLIESVTYTAAGICSPSKGSYHWIHQFGDRGEHEHGPTRRQAHSPHPKWCLPRLDVDSVGNLFFVRLHGNSYDVHNWIIA